MSEKVRSTFLVSLFLSMLMTAGIHSWGADVSCIATATNVNQQSVTYEGPYSTVSTDQRGTNGTVQLQGLLAYPDGIVKNAPVIIFNHGHEQDRGVPAGIRDYFVKRGFVVFMPLRRGHFYDDNVKSTGVYIDTFVSKCMRSQAVAQNGDMKHLFCNSVFCRQSVSCSDPNKANAVEVNYLKSQRDDVKDQVEFILSLNAIGDAGKLADPDRITIMGHSYGGSAIIFANEILMGQNVAIDISGAELSWGNAEPFWQKDLTASIGLQKRPIYMLQPKNGKSLLPTKVLYPKTVAKKMRAQAGIFGPAPFDLQCMDFDPSCWDDDLDEVIPEWKQAHGSFLREEQLEDAWGCSVIEFVTRYQSTN